MAKRRSAGEGTVYCRKDKAGKITDWVAQITYDGKMKTFTGKTRKDAAAKLDEFKRGNLLKTSCSGGEITLEEYLKYWLWEVKRRSLKDSSFDRLEGIVNCNIVPFIGKLKLTELNYDVIQSKVINRLQDDGKSFSTIKKVYNTLNDSLHYAIFPKKLLSVDPMLGVKMPPKERFEIKEIRYFSEDEVKRFKEAALAKWGNGKAIYPLGDGMILLLNTGVRIGEALAWKWKDYDEEKGLITVTANLTRVKDREAGEGRWKVITQTPKTEKGKRIIPVNAVAREALNNIKSIRYFGEDSPILAQEDGTTNTIDNYSRTFEAIVKRAGIPPCGIHTLRHTFATQMIAKGVDVKVVSTLLGHASVEITYNTYVHVLSEQKAQAVELLENI